MLGRIPADRLYPLGLNILKMYPLPNNQSTTIGTNHQFIQPTYDTLLYQPALRLDYQMTPGLRVSFKYQGNNMSKRVTLGSLPGWNDAIVPIPEKGTEAVTVNYNINATTFLEGTYGRAGNQLAGCGGLPVNDVSDARTTGLANFPLLFPDANVINPDYYAYEILQFQNPPYWDGTRIFKVPAFSWGNRVVAATGGNTAMGAPPNVVYPGFLNINTTQDVAINLTKVMGRHTFKTGYYNNHSLKRENNVLGGTNFGTVNFQQDTVGVNPFDTSFGFSNAAIGSFSNFVQASKYVEGTFKYDNREAYVQDNWKVKSNWSIDYGVRFVHAVPQHDALLQSGNFLPGQVGAVGGAGALRAGLRAATPRPAPASNRSAKNPVTGALLGPNTRARRRHARAELGPGAERSVPVGERDRRHDVPLPEAECRPALRHGLRHVRHAALRPARVARHLLRPAARRQRAGAGWQHLRLHAADAALLAAAEPGRTADAVTRAAHGLPVPQQAADLDRVEHRHPDADSVVDVR